jgi:hypothetical protein
MSLYSVLIKIVRDFRRDNKNGQSRDIGPKKSWRYQRGKQNLYFEEGQTTQWPKEKGPTTISKHCTEN